MGKSDALCLEVVDFVSDRNWRWRLVGPTGKFLADHQVDLDAASPKYRMFVDLAGYLEKHVAPDKWPQDEVEFIQQLGAWMGERVLGSVAAGILNYGTPVTVRVIVPAVPGATQVFYLPLELAHVDGRPLAMRDVSLVFELAGEAPRARCEPVSERLRMLAVFSLPTDLSALALRRERYALNRIVRRIAQTHSLAIDFRVLQYGVTRDTLSEALEEGEGWDLVHFSGHGLPSGLMFEKPTGETDIVTTDELKGLLRTARGRLKLVTLSSCLSAAAALNETLLRLGISPSVSGGRSGEAKGSLGPIVSLARALVQELDCAVLAMRYAVGDDFAIALAGELYGRLIGKQQALPRALQRALPAAIRGGPHPGVPPLSVATPALFGQSAVDLVLQAPSSAPPNIAAVSTALAYFPPEPERFVGRTASMARASAAMAPESGKTGVLFFGMAGAGKTACALELAYRYQSRRFQCFVWHKAPDEGTDVEGALLALALDMEKQLPGLKMAHLVDRADEFNAWLPRLTELLQQLSILIVVDNLESLLTPAGIWRDQRWKQLLESLLLHRGLSRTVITSRIHPGELNGENNLQVEPIHALSLDEAVLLARELPNLARLFRGENSVGLRHGRQLVARTLAVVQGHPELMKLAEAQASDPEALAHHLEHATEAWASGKEQLQAFFLQGRSELEADRFVASLVSWAHNVASALPMGSRNLFCFLCALEEGDRQSEVANAVWPSLWQHLRKQKAPQILEEVRLLTRAGLVESRPVDGKDNSSLYFIHPTVAAAGRALADDDFQAAVNSEMARFWGSLCRRAVEGESTGGSNVVVQAGLNAVPYLLRRRRLREVCLLLDVVIQRDHSPQTASVFLPLLRRIVEETKDTELDVVVDGLLAALLRNMCRWTEAEHTLRGAVPRAVARGMWHPASTLIGDLIYILLVTGRPGEALPLCQEVAEYTKRAGLGPWSQLVDEAMRLRVLNALGRHEDVLLAVPRLRQRMRAPRGGGKLEATPSWNARERVFFVAAEAASALGRWEDALEFNKESINSANARGASANEVARVRVNDYYPLWQLGRASEARKLLDECRVIAERERDMGGLCRIFSGLAILEGESDHLEQAVYFQEAALRYSYLAGIPDECSANHFNLGSLLARGSGPPGTALAHLLAGFVIQFLIGRPTPEKEVREFARQLALLGARATLPMSFNELCRIAQGIDGVRFRELVDTLPCRAASGDEALRTVMSMIRQFLRKTMNGLVE